MDRGKQREGATGADQVNVDMLTSAEEKTDKERENIRDVLVANEDDGPQKRPAENEARRHTGR